MKLAPSLFTTWHYEANNSRPTTQGRQPKTDNLRAMTHDTRPELAVEGRGSVVLGDDFPGAICQSFGLGQKLQALDHFRVGFSANLHAFVLPEGVDENL